MWLKEHSNIGKLAVALVDSVLVVIAFYLAYWLFAVQFRIRHEMAPPPISWYFWIVFVFIPLLGIAMNHYGLLSVERSRHSKTILVCVAKAFLMIGLLLSGTIFLAKAKYFSRSLLAAHWGFTFALVAAEKTVFNYLGRQGIFSFGPVRAGVLVGQGEHAEMALKQLENDPGRDVTDEAVFTPSRPFEEFREYLLKNQVDEVFFAIPRNPGDASFHIDRYLSFCERLGIPASVLINMGDVLDYFKSSFTLWDEDPVVVFHPPTLDPDRATAKRLIDLAGASVGLILTAVATPLIAALIRLDTRGPVFFHQERVGRNGRRFTMHKFRTMVAGAEEMKDELAAHNEMEGPMFKMEDDPRITSVGRFLRRFSLDELPQFWNVIKGDMSLVGTRPPTPEEVENYELWHYRRISIRPGMTGLWQVSGRHEIKNFHDIVRLDLKYIGDWSLWVDMKILAKTLFHFARGQ